MRGVFIGMLIAGVIGLAFVGGFVVARALIGWIT